jgi:hypothetical protein
MIAKGRELKYKNESFKKKSKEHETVGDFIKSILKRDERESSPVSMNNES